jgi:hypothetical protein
MVKSPADKARRQQKIAIGAAILLVVVLAVQVPRTLKMIKGSATPVPAPATAASSDAPVPTTPVAAVPLTDTEPARKALPRGTDFRRKDPFAARTLGPTGAVATTRRSGDPGFRLARGAAPTADTPTPTKNGNFVVVLRSLPARGGRAAALRAAADFRRRGVANAGVLLSTKYGSLRRGYYVVHAGRFPNRLAALEGLLAARRAGAETPYVRPLKA